MSTALPVELYRDPALILADAEAGDVIPITGGKGEGTCFDCPHIRPALRGPACAIHCMPSARTGRCRRWGAHH